MKNTFISPWLDTLSTDARTALLYKAKTKTFSPGQMVHHKNSPADGLYGVISGEVSIRSNTLSGEEIVFTRIIAGQWYGEIGLLDGGNKTHDGIATTASQLAIVAKPDILSLCQQYPCVHQALVLLLCQHCRQAFQAIDDFLLCTPQQRLAKWVLSHVDPAGRLNIKQKELGALIGISRQSTNKILKSWQQLGGIHIGYGELRVLDADTLADIAKGP